MYELRCSYFATATAIVFDDIDSGKARVLPLSKFIELVKTHGEYFHGELTCVNDGVTLLHQREYVVGVAPISLECVWVQVAGSFEVRKFECVHAVYVVC